MIDKISLTKKTLIHDAHRFLDIKPVIVKEADSLSSIAKSAIMHPKNFNVYVADKEDKLIGIIPLDMVYQNVFYPMMTEELAENKKPEDASFIEGQIVIAKDIMIPPVYMKTDDTVRDAFIKMHEKKLEELPIVNDRLKVTGFITIQHLLNIWLLSHFWTRKVNE
jgi:CBS domain-containing protein